MYSELGTAHVTVLLIPGDDDLSSACHIISEQVWTLYLVGNMAINPAQF